ncbi:MAG TPA: DUF4292 domain-containing protein [Saprospiraceae bacterium]|nr:DUF4292 domain-containing protein [Saprospiraceae bacterium]
MKRIYFLLAAASIMVFAKCTTTQHTTGKPPVVLGGISEASALLDLVRATSIPYDWYSASGTGTIDWDDQRLSAKVNVRLRRDSVIWVEISKLGIEVGRMLVTPDSAFFINRIERKYARYGTNDFFKKYNLPADFEMFSKVFTGGAYIPHDITRMIIEADGALFLESASGVSARHYIDTEYQPIRSQVMDPNHHEWQATYGDYRAVNTGQKFPFHRGNTLMIDGEGNLFDLDYSTITVNVPQEFPFSIPSHYEKM